MLDIDKKYEKGLEYTQIKDLSYKKHTKAIFNTTYLNSTNANIWENKFYNFLLGIYIVDNDEFINNKEYRISLNNSNISKYTEVMKTEELYKNIPARNPYAKYYIISFDKNNTKAASLKLLIEHSKFGKVNVSF